MHRPLGLDDMATIIKMPYTEIVSTRYGNRSHRGEPCPNLASSRYGNRSHRAIFPALVDTKIVDPYNLPRGWGIIGSVYSGCNTTKVAKDYRKAAQSNGIEAMKTKRYCDTSIPMGI